MNNQKQISLFDRIRNCTKKANNIIIVLVAIVMLYEEASITPPIIHANVLETESVNYKSYNVVNETKVTSRKLNNINVSKTNIMCSNSVEPALSSEKNITNKVTSSQFNHSLVNTPSDKSSYNLSTFTEETAQDSASELEAEKLRQREIYNNINITGYLKSNLNVRSGPSIEGTEVYEIFTYGTEVTYGNYDEYWAVIKYGDTYAYLSKDYISDTPLIKNEGYDSERKGNVINLPSGLGTSNTFMAWQMVTSKNSPQYKLRSIAGQKFNYYGYGIIDGRYAVATTSTYGEVGDYIDILRSDGSVLKAVIADIKNQNDYGCNKWGHNNGDVVIEFIVDFDMWYERSNGALSGYKILTSTEPGNNNNPVVSITNMGKYLK